MNLSAETADALLDKLSSDDDFRSLFQNNPRAALAEVGHVEAADPSIKSGAWDCCAVKQLAPKEAIKASRDALRKMLLSAQAGHNPIQLENARR